MMKVLNNRVGHQTESNAYIQPQMEVGKVDDEYEKEANDVADKVIRMPEGDQMPKMRSGSKSIRMMKMNGDSIKMGGSNEGTIQMAVDSPVKIQKMSDWDKDEIFASLNIQQNNSTVQNKFKQLMNDPTNTKYSESDIDNITTQFNGYDEMEKTSDNTFKLKAGWQMKLKKSPNYGTMTLSNTQITITHKVNGKWIKGPVNVIEVKFSKPFGFAVGNPFSGNILHQGYIYGNKFYIKDENGTYSNPLDLSK